MTGWLSDSPVAFDVEWTICLVRCAVQPRHSPLAATMRAVGVRDALLSRSGEPASRSGHHHETDGVPLVRLRSTPQSEHQRSRLRRAVVHVRWIPKDGIAAQAMFVEDIL